MEKKEGKIGRHIGGIRYLILKKGELLLDPQIFRKLISLSYFKLCFTFYNRKNYFFNQCGSFLIYRTKQFVFVK